eukprot:TRINITY_DN2964_c0_g1_i1.p1 TRINITY_DN2964_c0_g1~~TRINITY_DN2964_c0_g1_i1.p1  ORF type:complete len:1278 (-),score=278.25 TRINITY_DN2964_c0_g1_i1:93-3926(-)
MSVGSRVTANNSPTVQNIAGNAAYAEVIEWDFGNCDITNGNLAQERITLTFDYTVPNDVATYSSDLKEPVPNTGQPWEVCIITVQVFQDGVEVAAVADTEPYEIVDCQLDVQKYLDGNNTFIDAGDILQFSVDVSHLDSFDGDADENSFIPVHDMLIYDSLNSFMTIVIGSVTITPSNMGVVLRGNTVGDTDILVNISSLGILESVRVEYQATLAANAPSGTKLLNTAEVTATRTGYGNTQYRKNNTATVTTAQKEAEIRVNGTSLVETGQVELFEANNTDIAIGEIVEVEIRLLLPEGISEDNEFELIFATSPAVLVYHSYSTRYGSNMATSGKENVTTSDTNSDGYIDSVFLDFGTITNTPDNQADENDVFTLAIKCYAPDVATNVNGALGVLQVKVVFSLGDQICYEVKWNYGASKQILFPLVRETETAAQFFDYYSSRAHTGNEEVETALVYFVYDNTNQTAFVLVYDKQGAADGGFAFLTVTSDGLTGFLDKTGQPVRVLLEDDGGPNNVYCPMIKNDFILNSGWNGNDAYCWDTNTGVGYFNHKWNSQYTDGMVLGYLPNENWCFRMDWNDYFRPDGSGGWRPDRPRLEGITQIALMSQDEFGVLQKNYFPIAESFGLEVCGYSCNQQKGQLASRTTTLKFDMLQAQLTHTSTPNVTYGDANDAVSHTVQIRHPNPTCVADASDPTASCAPAYNMTATVYIDAAAAPLVLGSASGSTVGGTPFTLTATSNSQITVYFDMFPETEVFTLRYDTLVQQLVEPSQIITTTTNLIAYTARSQYARIVTNTNVTETFAVLTPALVSLTISDTSFAGTGSAAHNSTNDDLAVGESARLNVNVLLPEATTNISILVEIPRVLGKVEVTDSNLLSVGASIVHDTSLQAVGSPGRLQDLDSDGIADAVLFNLGLTINTANNVVTGADEVNLQVDVRLIDHPLNTDGKNLPLTATLFYSDKNIQSSAYIDVVGPTITLSKSSSVAVADYNDVVTYTVVVTVSGSTDSYNTMFTDTVPSVLTVTGTSTTKGTDSYSGNHITVDLGTMTPPSSETITYTTTVNLASQALPQNTVVTNEAITNYLVLPGEPYANRTARDSHSITITHICGNGATGDPETCDDGGTTPGDGCSATCTIEPGYVCNTTVIPTVCSICGDGIVTSGVETCDDGATISGDGCNNVCQVEPGWYCTGAPSNCVTMCGDGIIAGIEVCDDGNTVSGDCCSSTCTVEGTAGVTLCRCTAGGPSQCASTFKCWSRLSSHPLCCSIPNVGATCPDRIAEAPSL